MPALAAAIIAVLAIAMVLAVQAFDTVAIRAGGTPVLPLTKLFDGIEANPAAPEYWWVYALLLSTMIPSLLNLAIGGTSLLRGIPGLPVLLLKRLPATGHVASFDREWIALVLTGQIFLGGILAMAVPQAGLVIAVIFHLLPWLGLGLLDTARAVAEADLPRWVLSGFWREGPAAGPGSDGVIRKQVSAMP